MHRHAIVLGFAAFAQVAAGCIAPTVIGGGTSGTGGDSSGSAAGGGPGSGGAGGGEPLSSVLALRYDELPPLDVEAGTTSGSGGDPIDPATLFIEAGPGGLSCGAPYGPLSGGCDASWHLSIALPPAAQVPGTYTFASGDVSVVYTEQDGDGDTCTGGGTNDFSTLEVVSIDAFQVVVSVTGAGLGGMHDPDGTYTAPRCGAAPPSPVNGVALHPDQIPDVPSGSSSVSSGGGVDPSSLIVVVGAPLPVCSDPFAVDCTSAGWEVSVTLPLSYQTPGVYSLDDVALNAGFGEWLPDAAGECSGGGGSFFGGTIEVVSISATDLVVRFAGVSDFSAELEQDLAITRCP